MTDETKPTRRQVAQEFLGWIAYEIGTFAKWVWNNGGDIFFYLFILAILVGLIGLGAWFVHSVFFITSPEGRQHQTELEFQTRDRFVQECLSSEQYTREECVIMAGQK